jgi:hypothetical protein
VTPETILWLAIVGFICSATGAALAVGGVVDRLSLILSAGGVAILVAVLMMIGLTRAFA